MVRFLERLLNLQRGDLARGILLFAYLFLIIASYIIGQVARDALFLSKFRPDELPYVDIAIAVLVGFVVAGYLSLRRRVSLPNLLVGSLLFFAANCVVFWWLAHVYRWPWLYQVIYVWVGIFGVLAPAQVWTSANYLLTTREAKRLFGLVGGGAISGAIFGGFFSNFAVKKFGTESLLLSISFFLVICAVLVVLIWRQRQAVFAETHKPEEESTSEQGPRNLLESYRQVRASSYLQAIAALICISSVVTSAAGWQLKAIAKEAFPEKDVLAAFLGGFQGYTGIASLVAQLALTSRLLRRFGIGSALFILPMALTLGSAAVLVWGTLWAAIFLKGSDKVLRYSIDKSSMELLYLPVPATVKIQVKSFIDTVIWRLGDGMAGLFVLIFAAYLQFTPGQISWVNLGLLSGWVTVAYIARTQYVATLRESIREHRLDAERASAPVLDRSTAEIFATNLRATDAKEILYALSLFDVSRNPATHPALRDLLNHPEAEVRQKALAVLTAAGDRSVLPQVEALLNDPGLGVRSEALAYLTRYAHIDPLARIRELGDFPEFSLRAGVVAFLARPGPKQDLETARLILKAMAEEKVPDGQRTRLEAARLIGLLPHPFEEELRQLLHDADLEVEREAIRAVGVHGNRKFIPRLLDRLADSRLAADIAEALTKFGDRVVGTLRDYLCDPTLPLAGRREVAGILGRIATPAAARVLGENLLESDTTLRFRVVSSLNKIRQLHPEIELDRLMIETALAAEIMGHYRSYQILGTLDEKLDSDNPMARGLRESMNQEIERIFRLLGLLYPQYDFHSAYVGLQSKSPVVHDNALEFLDNILSPQMRNLLVPLVDSEVSPDERARLANRLVGAKMESREEAVTALICSEDPWLKACGAYAVGSLGLLSLLPELDNCLNHPDPLLRETARQAKLRLASLSGAARD